MYWLEQQPGRSRGLVHAERRPVRGPHRDRGGWRRHAQDPAQSAGELGLAGRPHLRARHGAGDVAPLGARPDQRRMRRSVVAFLALAGAAFAEPAGLAFAQPGGGHSASRRRRRRAAWPSADRGGRAALREGRAGRGAPRSRSTRSPPRACRGCGVARATPGALRLENIARSGDRLAGRRAFSGRGVPGRARRVRAGRDGREDRSARGRADARPPRRPRLGAARPPAARAAGPARHRDPRAPEQRGEHLLRSGRCARGRTPGRCERCRPARPASRCRSA